MYQCIRKHQGRSIWVRLDVVYDAVTKWGEDTQRLGRSACACTVHYLLWVRSTLG